jgi:gliding motility-associated-like protein
MHKFSQILIVVLIVVIPSIGFGQAFVNGELNGSVSIGSIPNNWNSIPVSDPVCLATSAPEATVDILDATGPSLGGGIAGIPHSGNTFCSGLHAGFQPSYLWHEGIMQDVNGFAIGDVYEISFYQSIVKQNNCLDESGSWRVYIDGALIGTSVPSTSLLAPDDVNLQWDNRILSFTATAGSHTIKFIPWDDDGNIQTSATDITGGLRMGIDSISFYTTPPIPAVVDLGNDTILCVGDTITLNAANENSTYLWQDNSTDSLYIVYQQGYYIVEGTNSYGTVSDTVYIAYESIPNPNLGEELVVCLDESVTLNATTPNATYLWQDNSTNSSFIVDQPGMYSVVVTNMCGTTLDEVNVVFEDCSITLEMPNVFTPNSDGANDFFAPVIAQDISQFNIVILNRWGEIVYESSDFQIGWNGKSKGLDCVEGVYFWIVDYSDLFDNKFKMNGNLNLLR